MQKFKWFLLVIVVSATSLSFIAPAREKINWVNINDLDALYKENPKPILVDLYTGWCGWCKVMDKKTYSNKKVGEYLAQKFYPVKVDAESKQAITWLGKSYPFNSQYRTNEFALYLTRGQLSYPTTVIIPADGSGPQAIPGFLEPKDFELIVKYFGEGHYGKTSFEQFQKSFKASW